MPHYGIAAWCVEPAGRDRDVLGVAQRHGLAAVHLGVGSIADIARLESAAWRAAVRRRCRETGITISCLALNIVENMAICGARADNSSRRQFRDVFMTVLEFASEMAAPLIYVPSFGLSEITSDACLFETAELISRAAESACVLHIDVASENSLGPADTGRLTDLVGLGNFKILFDVYNPIRWGHCPLDIIAANFDSFAAQIHVKDGWFRSHVNAPLCAGDGDIATTVRELMRRGFDGTFVLENDYGRVGDLDMKKDLETLRMICDSQD